jgi:hypothetical protein
VISFALTLLIAATAADAPARYPEAVELFHCTFDASTDANFDGWPDRWTRAHGEGYPRYVTVQIKDEPSPYAERCLRIELDGGGAIAYSPPIAMSSLFSCVLEGCLCTRGLEHDRAFLSLNLLDADSHTLETYTTDKVVQSPKWQKLRLGPIAPRDPHIRFATIGLHLEPQTPQGRRDVHGSAAFTDVWLGCLPRLIVSTNRPSNLFTPDQPVEITCVASGFEEDHPTVSLELEDAYGKCLQRATQPLDTQPPAAAPPAKAKATANATDDDSDDDDAQRRAELAKLAKRGRCGKIVWKPAIPGPGFYRVRAAVQGPAVLDHQRSVSLAVIEPQSASADSEFAWELARGDRGLPLTRLSSLVCQAGVHRVKYPVWFAAGELAVKLPEFQGFCDRLASYNIEVVGLLCDPPAEVAARFGDLHRPSAADVFGAPTKSWYPALEPVLSQLSGQVSWWQLGDDRDTSFVGYPNLPAKIQEIRTALNRLGREVNLGLAWGWTNALPDVRGPLAWRFVSLSAQPALTAAELETYLQGLSGALCQRWVVIEPLARDAYATEVRAEDLVRRIIAAKKQHAEAIVASDPLDPQHGLLAEDGSPAELFVPWRTAALALGAAQYRGAVELPRGSHAEVFSRGEDAVMAVWNEQATSETLYLGEHVEQLDIWGRARAPGQTADGQVIAVGPQPVFLTGVNEAVARWRRDCTLDCQRYPCIVGQAQDNTLRMQNHFADTVSGTATLVLPEGWTADPKQFFFRVDRGEPLVRPLRIMLPLNATCGRHPVQIDFQIRAERPYRFSVYRHIEVGLGDVSIEIRSFLNREGQLEVEQAFLNETEQRVNFRCELFAGQRQRQKFDVLGLGPGREVHRYVFPDGAELVGRTLDLRAAELDGPRILNYRFTAEK